MPSGHNLQGQQAKKNLGIYPREEIQLFKTFSAGFLNFSAVFEAITTDFNFSAVFPAIQPVLLLPCVRRQLRVLCVCLLKRETLDLLELLSQMSVSFFLILTSLQSFVLFVVCSH